MSKKNQTVLITGASSGIGAAIAKKFSREGYDVILLGRNEKKLKSVQSECLGQAEILSFDLKNFIQNKSLLEKKLDDLSPFTTLINNAGVYHREAFSETSDDIWIEQFQVNLLAAVQITKWAWPHFIKNGSASILNISSTLGVKPSPFTSAYSAIKAAMINWTLSLAQEGGPLKIRANCICPGIIDTPIHSFHGLAEKEKIKAIEPLMNFQLLNSLGLPQDVAEAAYFLGSDLSRWTTGSILHVDGGIHIK